MIKETGGRRRISIPGLHIAAVAVLAGCVLALAACEDRPVEKGISENSATAEAKLNSILTQNPPKRYDPLVVTDKVWTGNTALRMQRGLPLPARFETPHGVALVAAEPMSLNDIANNITTATGVPVHISQNGPINSAAAQNTVAAMPMAYEGPLSGLLERVAGHFGIDWRYDGSTIEISRYETRVFVVESLPGTEKIEEGMQDNSSSGGSGGSGGSGSVQTTQQNTMTQNSKTSIDIKYWEELGQTLTSMLAGNGTAIVSPSLGTVTITTTPEIMRNIAQYIAQENQRLSRQIAINVEIYVVSLNEGLDFDLAFSTALNKIANTFVGNIAGIPATAITTPTNGFSGGGSLSVAILNPNNTAQQSVAGIITALSAIGNVATVAKFPLVTLNNRPVSRRVGEQIGYVASSQTSIAGTSGTPTTSLTPGAVPEGFSVQLTPRLLDDGRILLEYSLSDIDPPQFVTFNSQCGESSSADCTAGAGSSSIQVPTSLQRIFVQQSILKSGSTLIMGGNEEEDLAQNKQGVGSPDFYGLGGGIASDHSHTMIFFALTPQVLDVPHTEQN